MEIDSEHASKRKANQDAESNIPIKISCTLSHQDVQSPNDSLNNDTMVKVGDEKDAMNNKDSTYEKEVADAAVSEIQEIYRPSSSFMDQDRTHATSSKLAPDSQNIEQSLILQRNTCKREDININKMAGTVSPTDEPEGSSKEKLNAAYVRSKNDSSVMVQDHTQSRIPMQVDEPSASSNAGINICRKEKCAYGRKCYRANLQHKAKFSHPGDADYDIPDDREECPYGIKCYRKNPQHKMLFKHTAARRCRRKVHIPDPLSDEFAEESAEESVDESDYEPSTVGDSSENEVYSDKDESEWEDGTTG